MKVIIQWSGGKDSALALQKIKELGVYEISGMATSVNSGNNRVSMHGVRTQLIEKQAESMGFQLHKLLLPEMPDMETYNISMQEMLTGFKLSGIEFCVYGDVFLEDLRQYRVDEASKSSMQCLFPLWKMNSKQVIHEFVEKGFKSILICVNEKYLDKSFLGCEIDKDFLERLPPNVDPCGENGEYHSFVYDGPIFSKPISFQKGEIVHRSYKPVGDNKEDNCFSDDPKPYGTGFWYLDLVLGK